MARAESPEVTGFDLEVSQDELGSPADLWRQHSNHSHHSSVASPARLSPQVAVRRPSQRSASSAHSAPGDLAELMPKIAQKISGMEVVNPEVLRVTGAYQAFQQFAAPLRVGVDGNFHHKSRKSQKISTFWSHSWHGGHWKKILTLITFYNGTAAAVLGLLTGIAMMILFSHQLLPGFDRGFNDQNVKWSAWSLSSGFLVTVVVMVLWRPQTSVFLDRICISQDDESLKSDAIFSLAGFLQSSDAMLILWDPTWTDRLWCLFELAAFLKSKKSQQQQALIVRPIFLGPISIAVFITVFAAMVPVVTAPVAVPTDSIIPIAVLLVSGAVVAFVAVGILRNYFRDLDVMKQQLLAISFDGTRSSCCDSDHVSPSGEPLLCDRKIVKECVKIWFGSQQAFEAMVRSEVLGILNQDLTERVFSTAWCLGVFSPLLLAFVDLAASFSFDGAVLEHVPLEHHPTIGLLLEGVMIWAVALPGAKDLLIQLCRLMRKRPKNQALEFLKNAATIFVAGQPLVLLMAAYIYSRFSANHAVGRAYAFSAATLSLTVCYVLLGRALKVLLRRPGW